MLWFSVMEQPPLSKQALARIEAARLEAGADLLGGMAAFWRGIGMSSFRNFENYRQRVQVLCS